MSAEVLRRGSLRIRHDVEFGQANGDDAFLAAVADWLDRVAGPVGIAQGNGLTGEAYDLRQALAVARAYLGESS